MHTKLLSKIISIESPRPHIRILKIQKPADFSYEAGQYIMIGFGDLPLRPYSVANAPHEDFFEIHIKDNGGQVTPYIMNSLSGGEQVKIEGPFGNMIYDSTSSAPDAAMVFIAGGLGITPMKSIIEAAVKNDHNGEMILFWGTSSADDFYLDDYFEELTASHTGFECIKICPEPVGGEATSHMRKITAGGEASIQDHKIYIAGSPDMIESTIQEFEDIGAQRTNIHYDTFKLPVM